MSDSSNTLYRLLNEYQKIVTTEKRIVIISNEIKNEKANLKSLNELVEAEHLALLQLEGFSLRQIFSKILKNKKEQLEQKRQDYLLAALEFKNCEETLALLEYELAILCDNIDDKVLINNAIDEELDKLSSTDYQKSPEDLQELLSLINKLKDQIKLNVEVMEALEVTNELKDNFSKMISLLNDAQIQRTWGEFYRERLESIAKKKNYMDQAHTHILVIHKLLIILNNELKDVKALKKSYQQMKGNMNRFNVDIYVQLISDWINDKNLINTMTVTMSASLAIKKLRRSLVAIEEQTGDNISRLKKKREKLIERLNLNLG